jgi:hypothetical protein
MSVLLFIIILMWRDTKLEIFKVRRVRVSVNMDADAGAIAPPPSTAIQFD